MQRLERELRRLPKPLAVFTSADDIAVLVMQACEEAGLHIPEEVAVLGCHNDVAVCEYAPVALSSVDEDLELQGYEAARVLDQRMDGMPAPAAPLIIPPKGVVTRTSTDILAVPRVEVARALRYIWEHYTEPIQIADVATAAHLARRSLTRLFQQHLGRSVGAEIARKRIEQAKQLLSATDLKAWQVAEQTGFSSMEHLGKAFTRVVGEAPSRFREHHREARVI
jgi:LacI family transcriptional regulator